MTDKYNSYLDYDGCKNLSAKGYSQVLSNVVEDDESYITEDMKKEFFEHMQKHDATYDVIKYCDDFFDEPKGAPLSGKKYILKGKKLDARIYKVELGRVAPKKSFRRSLNRAILNQSISSPSSVGFISDIDDESLLESLLIDSNDRLTITDNPFREFLTDSKIGGQKIQEHPMWTFEGLDDDDVYLGVDIKDLPCLLGLPGPERTEKDYEKIPRITFSLNVPNTISVHKPTAFDAGVMTVWRCGGKTKSHSDCETKYGTLGLEEYVHEPINFNHINSDIYSI